MATESDHVALANKNHDVLIHLLGDVERFPEWVTIAAFYKAVQIVEAVFRNTTGRCCHGHQHRLEQLKARGHESLYKHYRALWSASSVARYLQDSTSPKKTFSSFTDYISAESVKKSIVEKRLRGVECEAMSLLSQTAKNQLKRIGV